jgi:predicted alpha/beta-hydrolase family hydrolase
VSVEVVGGIAYPTEVPARALLVLAHGAGAGQKHPFMVAVARALAARGIAVVTFDFPYMRRGRGVPDKAPVLEESFRHAIEAARAWQPGLPVFAGGKSMGGRMATHLAAQRLEGLAGIVALGYPLHPPGNPDRLRTEHLPSIVVPVLIVQGERDTFGTPEELRTAIAAMQAPVTLHAVPGADHSLAVRGKTRETSFERVLDTVATWILGRTAEISGAAPA